MSRGARLAGDARVASALATLAIARGGMLDEFAAQVYLDLLGDLPVPVIVQACDDLARQPRHEYESALPSVGTIRAHAEHRERAERPHWIDDCLARHDGACGSGYRHAIRIALDKAREARAVPAAADRSTP